MTIPINPPARGVRARALRLGLGAVVAGSVLAAVPAMASATTSTCTYNTSNKNLIVTDKSGDRGLRVFRVGEQIRISDEPGTAGVFCPIPRQQPATATVHQHRADRDLPRRPAPRGRRDHRPVRRRAVPSRRHAGDRRAVRGRDLDRRRDRLGLGFDNNLRVYGTPQYDSIMVGTRGRVNLGLRRRRRHRPSIKPDNGRRRRTRGQRRSLGHRRLGHQRYAAGRRPGLHERLRRQRHDRRRRHDRRPPR